VHLAWPLDDQQYVVNSVDKMTQHGILHQLCYFLPSSHPSSQALSSNICQNQVKICNIQNKLLSPWTKTTSTAEKCANYHIRLTKSKQTLVIEKQLVCSNSKGRLIHVQVNF